MRVWMMLLFSFLVKSSNASEMDDRNNQTETTAGNCIRSKWEEVLSVCDVNKDGKLSFEDMEKGRKTFTQLTKIKGQEKILREGMFTRWFNACMLWNQLEIAEKDYGVLQKDAFLKDNDSYVEIIKTCEDLWQNLVNTDNNDYLSEKEYTTALRAIGQTDEKKDKAYIKAFNPGDKGILLTNLYNYWVSYLKVDDCTKIASKLDKLKG